MSDIRDLFQRLTDIEPTSTASAMLARAEARAGRLARRRTQRMFLAGAIVAVLVVGAIAIAATAGGKRGSRVPIAGTTTTTPSVRVTATQYEVDTEVEQDASHGPVLCLGPQALVFGMLCGGVPLADWDWAGVTGHTTTNGITSGSYHVVGTYDGTTFTVTEPPGPSRPAQPEKLPNFAPPCPTPAGGWTDVDPARMTENDYERFSSTAQQQPDSAGLWVDAKMPVNGAVNVDPAQEVNTAAFTGHLDEHRAQLRVIWGGPLCVVQRTHSTAELEGILTALRGPGGKQFGLGVRFGDEVDVIHDVGVVDVVAATPAMQQAVDQKYGAGIVKLVGLLRPDPSARPHTPFPGGARTLPTPPTTSPESARVAGQYVGLVTPLKAAIANVAGGFVYSNPSKVVRAAAIQAITTFDTAASSVSWPPSVAPAIANMVRGGPVLIAELELANKRDPQSVAKYRGELDHVASAMLEPDASIGAALGLPQPTPR